MAQNLFNRVTKICVKYLPEYWQLMSVYTNKLGETEVAPENIRKWTYKNQLHSDKSKYHVNDDDALMNKMMPYVQIWCILCNLPQSTLTI